MRKLLIAALVTGQVLGAAAPAFAQSYAPVRETEAGAFGGIRVRISFGDGARESVRAGLAFAPAARTAYQDGRVRTRLGEGMELGYRSGRPVSFSLAGRDLGSFRLNAAQGEEPRHRRGVSPLVWVGIGVGVLAIAAVALFESCRSGDICGSDRDP